MNKERLALMGIMSLVGITLAGFGFGQVREGVRSMFWPSTQGVIERANYTEARTPDGDRTFHLDFRYRFSIGGATYRSDRGRVDGDSSRSAARAIARRYPAGSTATIYYDPQSPDRAVLRPGVPSGSLIQLLGGLLLMGLAVAVYRQGRQRDGWDAEIEGIETRARELRRRQS